MCKKKTPSTHINFSFFFFFYPSTFFSTYNPSRFCLFESRTICKAEQPSLRKKKKSRHLTVFSLYLSNMASTSPSSGSRPLAVLMIGNAGAGKSTLLTQLGAKTFKAGATFRQGFTKDVYEEEIELNGQRTILVDVPGLFEPDDRETQFNARKLTQALSKGYDYKLYFVLKASNRGPEDRDLVMMSKINECIQQADGSRVSFRLIVNQIPNAEVYDMYKDSLANDNCESLFKIMAAEIPEFSFDIKIDGVTLLMFNLEAVNNRGFKERITDDVRDHSKYALRMGLVIKISNLLLKLFHEAMQAIGMPFAATASAAAEAVVGAVLELFRARREF